MCIQLNSLIKLIIIYIPEFLFCNVWFTKTYVSQNNTMRPFCVEKQTFNTDYCILLLRIAWFYCSRIGWQPLLERNSSKSNFWFSVILNDKIGKKQKLKTKILSKPWGVKIHQNLDTKNVLRAKIKLLEAKPCSTSSKTMLFEQDPAKP